MSSLTDSTFTKGVETFTSKIVTVIIEPIILFLIGLTIILFIFGFVKFFFGDDETSKENGKKHMLWGVIGMFIAFSVWGIIALLAGTISSFR